MIQTDQTASADSNTMDEHQRRKAVRRLQHRHGVTNTPFARSSGTAWPIDQSDCQRYKKKPMPDAEQCI
jgi:hypothetical protein